MLNAEEIKNTLSEKALEAIDTILNEGMGKGKIKRRFHASGASTKHKVGQSSGQKASNTGRSAGQRKRSAKKMMKSKKKKYGGTGVNKKILKKQKRGARKAARRK